MKNVRTLFLTRKYPPSKGGMESYSYNLITSYKGDKRAITLGGSQINLIWFLPYAFIYTLINAKRFDVIQLGDLLLSVCGWGAKKINPQIAVVVTIHGLDMTFPNRLYQLYLKLFSHGFDMYVPNSGATLEIAQKRGYTPLQRIAPATLNEKNTRFPLKNKKTFCNKYQIPDDSFIILTVGRLVKRKGVEWFLRNVLSKYDNPKLVYFVAGEGVFREQIENSIIELNESRIHLLGRVSDSDLAELYVNVDVMLMPNIFVEDDVEGFGMVATEACAAGALVVASNIQGIADAITDGKNGVLYPPEDSLALIRIIEDIYKNPERYTSIKQNASQYVLDHFTGEAIANKYEELIIKVSENYNCEKVY